MKDTSTANINPQLVDTMEKIYDKEDHMLSREARITADMNVWKIATLCLSVAVVMMTLIVLMVFSYNKTPQVYWAKLYPDGGWDVNFYDQQNLANSTKSFDFYKNTVDSLLTSFVKFRYSKNPYTIRNDYGRAQIFMGSALYRQFVAKDEGNAANVAIEYSDCKNCKVVEIKIRNIHHINAVNKMITNKKDDYIYITTFHVTEIERTSEGMKLGQKPKIINLQWRLLTEPERVAKINALGDGLNNFISLNPLFLEVISASYEDDIVIN